MSGLLPCLLAVMNSRLIFGMLGNISAFIMFLLPARDLYKIWRGRIGRSTQATEKFSSSPILYQYHATMISCALWAWYGGVNGDIFLKINILGVVLEMIYLNLFILLIARTCQGMTKHYVILLVELSSVFVLGSFALTLDDPAKFSGNVCLAGNILLSVLKIVYWAQRWPVDESAASFVNGSFWSFYGLVSSDAIVLVPNLVGTLVELVRYATYGGSREAPVQISEELELMSSTDPDLPEVEFKP